MHVYMCIDVCVEQKYTKIQKYEYKNLWIWEVVEHMEEGVDTG